MKKVNLLKSIVIPLLGVILFMSCGDDDKNSESQIQFEGLILTNDGLDIREHGQDVDDWSKKNNLTDKEKNLLSFEDALSLPSNKMATAHFVTQYPNPTVHSFRMQVQTDEEVKLKLVIVNQNFELLEKKVLIGKHFSFNFNNTSKENPRTLYAQSSSDLTFNTNDRGIFKSGLIIRVYYSFSVSGHENYYYGYGDVLICDSPELCI